MGVPQPETVTSTVKLTYTEKTSTENTRTTPSVQVTICVLKDKTHLAKKEEKKKLPGQVKIE